MGLRTSSISFKSEALAAKSKTYCVRRDGLEPVIIEVEQHHLRFCRLQNEITKLLHLQTGLERQLQLRAFDHNVGEVKQVDLHRKSTRNIFQEWIKLSESETSLVICIACSTGDVSHLKRIQHAFPGHNDLFWLLLHGEGANQSSHFFSCLPFGQLQG